MNHCVQLVIATETVETRNALMGAVRIRISPWQLLYTRIKKVLLDEKMCDQALNALLPCAKRMRPVENHVYKNSCTLVEAVEDGAPIAKGLNVLSGFVETVAIVAKRCVAIARDVVEVAQFTQ